MLWLVVAYLGSLAVLLVSAFWSTNSFTGDVVHTFTTTTSCGCSPTRCFARSRCAPIGVALAVTVIDALLALPLAFYMSQDRLARGCGWPWSSRC